jgi:hypothetical protein
MQKSLLEWLFHINIILVCTVLLRIPHTRIVSAKYGKELRLTINKISAKLFKWLGGKGKSRKKELFSKEWGIYCNRFDQCIARQGLHKHCPTRNNITTGLCNPFLGNSSVNTLPRKCNDVTTTMGSCHVTCVFCRQQPACWWTCWVAVTWHVFSVRRVCAAST